MEYLYYLDAALIGGDRRIIDMIIKEMVFIDYINPIIKYGRKHPELLRDILKNNEYKESDMMIKYSIGYSVMQKLHVYDLYDNNWGYLGVEYEYWKHKETDNIFRMIKSGKIDEFRSIFYKEREDILKSLNFIKTAARKYDEYPNILNFMMNDKIYISLFKKKELQEVLSEYGLIELFREELKTEKEKLTELYKKINMLKGLNILDKDIIL